MSLKNPVSTIMSESPVVGNPSTPFSQVLRLFTEFPVHHLPIVNENNKLVGIVSTNDLPKIFLSLCSKPTPISMTLSAIDGAITLGEIMTANPITIDSTAPISKAVDIFQNNRFMALPVVEGGALVGILSLKDVVAFEV